MYLVDTNVISVRAPSKVASTALDVWMDKNSPKLFLSVVTIAEIEDGVAKARREGAMRKAADLAAWLETVLHLYGQRIFAVDVAVARIAGVMSDLARGQGQAPGFADIVIAATAKHHGLLILTRNLKHFEPLNIPTHDPFSALPA